MRVKIDEENKEVTLYFDEDMLKNMNNHIRKYGTFTIGHRPIDCPDWCVNYRYRDDWEGIIDE